MHIYAFEFEPLRVQKTTCRRGFTAPQRTPKFAIVQDSAESGVRFIPWIMCEAGRTSEKHPYARKNMVWVRDRGRVCEATEVWKGRAGKLQPWNKNKGATPQSVERHQKNIDSHRVAFAPRVWLFTLSKIGWRETHLEKLRWGHSSQCSRYWTYHR